MNWRTQIAQRIYLSRRGTQGVSGPAVRIAVVGIAIGLVVMMLSVAVVVGFKHQVRDTVAGLSADVVVRNFDAEDSYQTRPIRVGDSLLHALAAQPGVLHVQRFATKPGMIKTDTDFLGVVMKGVGRGYDTDYLRRSLVAGSVPVFSDTTSTGKVLISHTMAQKLRLDVGSKFNAYFIEGNMRIRRFEVAGIFKTGLPSFDGLFLLCDLHTVARLNNWQPGQVTGVEIKTPDAARARLLREALHTQIDTRDDGMGGAYYTQTLEELNPQLFAWLDLMDTNMWVILFLMMGVAGFTMISGLLILILERTNMIGVLKALGATNGSVREIFLKFALMLVGKGMLWGNVVALLLCTMQYHFQPFRLDPSVYYIDHVPVELSVPAVLLINVGTFAASLLMLVGPSYLISHIHPATSMRFE